MKCTAWIVIALTLASASAAASSTHPQPVNLAMGIFPAPPVGGGPGTLAIWPAHGAPFAARFGPDGTTRGNSFYAGYDADQQRVYIPSVAGVTVVLDARNGKVLQEFSSLSGGRVARVSPDHRSLLVLSGKQLADYALPSYKRRFLVAVGGNALAFTAHGHSVFVGGNMDPQLTEVRLPTGEIKRRYPIRRSGDLVWAGSQIFSADIQSGVLTALNPKTGRIVRIPTKEVDPHFSYARIASAKAGFMQLAAGPHERHIYAAGFSGHILRFSVHGDRADGSIPVALSGPKRLSGLIILPGGRTALVTIENRRESVVVELKSGKVLRTAPGIASNRWIAAR